VEWLAAKGVALDRGADRGGHAGITPAISAAEHGHLPVLRFLAEKGAALGHEMLDGCTAVIMAAQNGKLEVVRFLTGRGVSLNHGRDDGATALHLAGSNNHLDVVRFLADTGRVDIDRANGRGMTLLFQASALVSGVHGALVVGSVVLSLSQCAATLDPPPPNSLPSQGQLDLLRLLLNKGADVNRADDEGDTPAYMAAKARTSIGLEVIRLLVDNGADVNRVNTKGDTAALVAAQMGHLEVLRFLDQNGASLDHVSLHDGSTLLYVATVNGRLDVVRFLVSKGVDVNQGANDGGAPVYVERCAARPTCYRYYYYYSCTTLLLLTHPPGGLPGTLRRRLDTSTSCESSSTTVRL